jgi:N-acyl-phosphatidylethanolamine-hydrolysing phospholipase D
MALAARPAALTIALALALVLGAAGCGTRVAQLAGIGTRNAAHVFGEVRAVPNKITQPVRPDARLAVLWVGQATVLIQLDDRFVLTDPVFTTSVGGLSRRLVEPGIEPEHLPPLDAVLISHLHFDHYSLGSLELIEPRVGLLALPEGSSVYLPRFRFPSIELRTWQSWERDGLRVTAVPVDHKGWRYGVDAAWMDTSFTGYVIEYHGLTVYFGGDTAYDAERFRETRRRFPAIDLALLPIAPIHPREFMRHTHIDPPEAVKAFEDLGAARMVPIHFDTFINSLDEPGEARGALLRIIEERGLGARVDVLAVGEQRILLPATPRRAF